jgi:hypothetical protein
LAASTRRIFPLVQVLPLIRDWLPSALISVGSTAAALWATYHFFAERLFGHLLDARLQRQKQDHEVQLERLKYEQAKQIEALRADIAHLSDREKRSNEYEHQALSEIWMKFVELYEATYGCVVSFIQLPDLDRRSDDQVVSILNRLELTKDEEALVLKSQSRNDSAYRVLRLRSISNAQTTYSQFRTILENKGIFIPNEFKEGFSAASDLCSRAILLRNAEERGRRPAGMTDDLDFQKTGRSIRDALRQAVSNRLFVE